MTITIQSSLASDLAYQMIKSINRSREEEWEKEILAEIKHRDFWRRFFPWLKPLDWDEARNKINQRAIRDSNRWGFGYTPNCRHACQENTCRSIIKLASNASYITLTSEEFNSIA